MPTKRKLIIKFIYVKWYTRYTRSFATSFSFLCLGVKSGFSRNCFSTFSFGGPTGDFTEHVFPLKWYTRTFFQERCKASGITRYVSTGRLANVTHVVVFCQNDFGLQCYTYSWIRIECWNSHGNQNIVHRKKQLHFVCESFFHRLPSGTFDIRLPLLLLFSSNTFSPLISRGSFSTLSTLTPSHNETPRCFCLFLGTRSYSSSSLEYLRSDSRYLLRKSKYLGLQIFLFEIISKLSTHVELVAGSYMIFLFCLKMSFFANQVLLRN